MLPEQTDGLVPKVMVGNGLTVIVADAPVMLLVRTHPLASVIEVSV